MRTTTNALRHTTLTVMLLIFGTVGHSQSPLTNASWQQRAKELAAELKNEWAEGLIKLNENQSITRSSGSTQVDLMDAEYIPIPVFVLDYDSFIKLTQESNIDQLIKLDTTRVYYTIKKESQYIVQVGAVFVDGKWISNGYGAYDGSDIDYFKRLFAKGFFCSLDVYVLPEQTFGYHIFYENGQLMATRSGIAKPLLEELLQFRDVWQRKIREGLE